MNDDIQQLLNLGLKMMGLSGLLMSPNSITNSPRRRQAGSGFADSNFAREVEG